MRLPFFIFLSTFYSAYASCDWFDYQATSMTTNVEIRLWAADSDIANKASQAIIDDFSRIEALMSSYIESSQVSLINRNAGIRPVVVSSELFTLIDLSKVYSRMSEGAFDISFRSVGYFYDFRKRKQPTDQEISTNLDRINFNDIILNEKEQSVFLQKQGMLIDLGGIAKGHAIDRAINILKKLNIPDARVSLGGDTYLLGDNRGDDWTVAIQNPRDTHKPLIILPARDEAISTSGDYQRFFIDEKGERVHHIIAPSSGRPSKGVRSTSVVAKNSTLSDALSTAVFILGPEKGLRLINKLTDTEAAIVDDKGKVYFSKGLMP